MTAARLTRIETLVRTKLLLEHLDAQLLEYDTLFEHVVPALRIIDDATWKEANRLLAQATRLYLRRTGGKLWGKPASNVESPYLLTGMLTCGVCGSVMGAESRPTGDTGKRLRVYWCRGNRHGRRVGGPVCPNNVVVAMRLLDDAVLQCISPT
jgi:hypothetical protein